jgi:hypothetical protein
VCHYVAAQSSFKTAPVAYAHTNVQGLVSVVKMATVLDEYTTEEPRSVVCFLWAKGLDAKDIHKEMFPLYGAKCLSRKVVPPFWQAFD